VHSFRQVPTFGRDTIRNFGGSVSSLKKMTARSFEDIIQVGPFLTRVLNNGLSTCSVGYLSLRDCFLNRITRSSWISRLTLPHGMHMQSSENTPSTPSGHSDRKQKNLDGSSATSPTRHARSTRQRGSQARRLRAFVVVPPRRRNRVDRQALEHSQWGTAQTSNASTWQPTRSTHSATMQTTLSVLAPLTALQLSMSVNGPSILIDGLKLLVTG
jgi:hypothetical protein